MRRYSERHIVIKSKKYCGAMPQTRKGCYPVYKGIGAIFLLEFFLFVWVAYEGLWLRDISGISCGSLRQNGATGELI
ncbi:hypothetical protein K450DRAFT_219630 [Umbelopsis ramanniana AG]|uniref:Uncharacterized protein n=1 Tax=Umbelopsis ramanniana AG TaxID=1314678 RepID=A0AAD5EJE9_UMBRA|nr:uncharacterized protein K450DRAFT_219630 [Umbelopsis ramanniana AG]KAI8584389.1 hypothetical protein K450DRAFT_219630 [Umbelopsis ramanniana AG]